MLVHRYSLQHIHNSRKVGTTQRLSVDEWVSRVWSVHMVGYYSVVRRNEFLLHATIWMIPVEIMLSEIS